MTSAIRAGTTLLLASAIAAACDGGSQRPSMGDANSLIVLRSDELWNQVADSATPALEQRLFTVRDERRFELTHVTPADSLWLTFQQWREILVIGTPEDAWVQQALGGEEVGTLPTIVERHDVWAHNQTVRVVVLPPDQPAQAFRSVLPELAESYQGEFRQYALERMYVSGRDVALQDTLEAQGGFTMLFPQVYEWERVGDAFLFRNHSEMTGTVNRTVLVRWREGVADSITAEDVLAWRDTAVASQFTPAQVTGRERVETRRLEGWPGPVVQAQGVWTTNNEGFPSAGPFITRAYVCPAQNRTYFVDAWLYAPDVTKSKYEYMIQLNTLLDSFRCGGTPRGGQAAADG